MKLKQLIYVFIIAFSGAGAALVANSYFGEPKQVIVQQAASTAALPANFSASALGALDFTAAAENTLSGVVHVKNMVVQQQQKQMTLWDFFYGNPNGGSMQPQQQQQPQVASTGSGVIISADGYIVTNNHVVEGSQQIEVTLNDNRTFAAKVIGTDPTTDIALLKVEATDLPAIAWGDSDELKVGEWVLAVGNPFNLTSTVTAGIVSAKGRNINIIDKRMAIESFIQTDAAVNPGNSGGALVNTRGQLIGINTAIASRTGSFSGYSFAVPSGIVKKIVSDITEYGTVQRAVLGVNIATMSSELAKQLNLDMTPGVLIADLAVDGSAAQAGLEKNDIITSVNGAKTTKASELQEQIGRHRPGDKVKVSIVRNGDKKEFEITLQNTHGSTTLVKNDTQNVLGAVFSPVANSDKQRLRLAHGMQITELNSGKLLKAGIQEGFIVVSMNDIFIDKIEDVEQAIKSSKGGVMVKGLYPNGVVSYYAFGLE